MAKMQEYYHIVTKEPFSIGQRITFDASTKNNLYNFFFKKEFRSQNGKDAYEIIGDGKCEDGLIINKSDANVILKYNDITIRAIRESILEMVRLEQFPEYPSRLNCLYVSRKYEDIMEWKNIFESYKRNIVQIVKIKANGNYFEGDGDLLPKEDAVSFESKIRQAKEYWGNKNEIALSEILVDGEIEIVEIIS